MKRDFDLIRKLLILFEERAQCDVLETPEVNDFSRELVSYHLRLLHDAGLLRCEPISSSTSDRVVRVLPFELTWDGHEFLDKIRSETTWKKIKLYSKEKGLALSFTLVTELAKRLTTVVLDSV